MKELNLGLRFLLELVLLFALGYWGFQAQPPAMGWILGLGAPLLAAVIWGVWIAPKSQRRLHDPLRQFVEIALFAAAVLALIAAQQVTAAVILFALVTLNQVLLVVWDQRAH